MPNPAQVALVRKSELAGSWRYQIDGISRDGTLDARERAVVAFDPSQQPAASFAVLEHIDFVLEYAPSRTDCRRLDSDTRAPSERDFLIVDWSIDYLTGGVAGQLRGADGKELPRYVVTPCPPR